MDKPFFGSGWVFCPTMTRDGAEKFKEQNKRLAII
jgi:hypothetical protein